MAKLLSTIIDGFLSSKKFVSGFLGEGWRLGKRGRRYTLEVDDVVVRHTMTVFELLISKIRAVKGALGISQGCGKVKEVREEEDVYVLTLEEENTFRANDLVRCQSFGQNSRAYWVRISSVKDAEVVVAKSEFSEDDSIPEAGDELVQFGNTTDTARQSAIYLSADENGIPAIDVLQGIHEKSFEGCTKVRVGGLDGIIDPDFPEGIGDFGIYCENGYFKGTIAGGGGYMLRSDGTGYICNGAIWWDKQKKVHFDGEVVLGWENLPADAKELLKGDKGDQGEAGDKGEDANLLPWVEEWDRNKTQIGSDYLITPKIFSGTSSETGGKPVLTGVAFGRDVCEIDGKKKSGIFGLNEGKMTFGIDAETGEATYGGRISVNNMFEVDTEGRVYAGDADISGRITAIAGKIGGFKISGNSLTNEGFDNNAAIIFRNDAEASFAAIGGNTLPLSTALKALLRLDNKQTGMQTNYGAVIDVTGGRKNIALNISNGDIVMGNGIIQNFCIGAKVITESYKIKDSDTYTIYMNGASKKVDLTLPDNPPVGKVIMARVWGSYDMGIIAPAGAKVVVRDDTRWVIIKANSGGTYGCLTLVYFGDMWTDGIKRWFVFEGAGSFSEGNS